MRIRSVLMRTLSAIAAIALGAGFFELVTRDTAHTDAFGQSAPPITVVERPGEASAGPHAVEAVH